MDENRNKIIDILKETYRGAKCGLDFSTPFELLIATSLSAQCTDIRVNKVTPVLFEKYPDAFALSKADVHEVEQIIKSCGCYKVKARNVIEASKKLVENFDGQVPKEKEKLVSLNGVGNKTANVVMANAFGIPAIAVDTHVFRVSNRIGLAHAKDVDTCEKQLQKVIKKEDWSNMHHALIWHGRGVCNARKPKCDMCNINIYCKYYKKITKE